MGPGPRLIKKNLLGRGLTKVEKQWFRLNYQSIQGTISEEDAVPASNFISRDLSYFEFSKSTLHFRNTARLLFIFKILFLISLSCDLFILTFYDVVRNFILSYRDTDNWTESSSLLR